MSESTGYKWVWIKDLPKNRQELASQRLKHLAEIWQEQKTDAENPGRTQALIPDQQDVIEGLFSFVKGDRQLSTSYIKEIHQALTRNQKTTEAKDSLGHIVKITLERGVWKSRPQYPAALEAADSGIADRFKNVINRSP